MYLVSGGASRGSSTLREIVSRSQRYRGVLFELVTTNITVRSANGCRRRVRISFWRVHGSLQEREARSVTVALQRRRAVDALQRVVPWHSANTNILRPKPRLDIFYFYSAILELLAFIQQFNNL